MFHYKFFSFFDLLLHAVFIQSVGKVYYHCCDMHMHSHVLSLHVGQNLIYVYMSLGIGDYSINVRINMHTYTNFWVHGVGGEK